MAFQTLNFFSGECVPHFAGSVVAASYESEKVSQYKLIPISIFVEGAIGKWEDVCLKCLE